MTDITKQQFENNLSILMLIRLFEKDFDNNLDDNFYDLITRDNLINFIQQLYIPDYVILWIKENMPNKLKHYVKYTFDSKNITVPFESSEKCYELDLIKLFVNEGYNLLNEKDKNDLCDFLFSYYDKPLQLLNLDLKTEQEIDDMLLWRAKDAIKKKYTVKNFFGFTKQKPTLQNKKDYLLSLTINCFQKQIKPIYSKNRIYKLFKNKIISDKHFLHKCIINLNVEQYNHIKLYFSNLNLDYMKKQKLLKDIHNLELYKEKSYYLNFDDHWLFFSMNQELYLEFIKFSLLTRDYSFCDYNNNDYSFLQNYNNNVKQNLINKIMKNNNYDRFYKIHTLNDLVDVEIFRQIPPSFLQLSYLDNLYVYNDILIKMLYKFNYDMNKLVYIKID